MPLVLFPDPALTTPARPVIFPLHGPDGDLVEALLHEMQMVMIDNNGIGIAANQVGVLLQVIRLKCEPYEAINPSWEPTGVAKHVVMEEGCMSQPGLLVKVDRPDDIWIKYQTRYGKQKNGRLDGLAARVWQHETDHLRGKNIGRLNLENPAWRGSSASRGQVAPPQTEGNKP